MKRLLHIAMAALLLLTFNFASAADTLGPGDVIKVSVYGNPDMAIETRITDAGSITFPLIGQVTVGGLSVPAAEKKIASMLESGGYLKKPAVTINVTQVQSQQVSVLGQVNRPGRYPLEGGKRSLMDLLAQAGGIAQDGGDVVNVIRTRNGQTTTEQVDVIEMVRTGQLTKDYDLAANDVIYVERAPKFYIYGEVQRPGAFRLERGMTVTQALSAGGGLTLRGTERGLQIKRRDGSGGLRTIDAKQNDLLQTDDVVYVKESWF
ncbi:polysaccharide export protein EpsE [Massilia arenosa]|uniref:Polysaccharide export protein EpsE n=1 Tax=Zemynaea arenosa TaxID=2561931 RepID=A0A4Y9SEM6_9BURK|nr:polysaccharide export protein EpsE [Massilia arenosa]TFW21147.1 polysaccharide export protein EpsE [Massilia arenosa]